MNREILFRGKRADGEWAFGSLLKVTYDGTTYNLIFADNFLFIFGEAKAMEHAAVIPETVGQYTGLTDKNGKKIFEGDIVKYGDDTAIVIWYEKAASFVRAYSTNIQWSEPIMSAHIYLEVIGNIHDNPELLEERHET